MPKNRLIIITAAIVSLGIRLAWTVHRPGTNKTGACNVGDLGR